MVSNSFSATGASAANASSALCSSNFGPSITANRDAVVQRYLQEGIEAYRQGNFLLAVQRVDAALDVDPSSTEVKKVYNKLHFVTGFIPSAAGESEEAASIRKGVAAYVEGDNKGAVNSFRYAYYKNPSNMKLLGMLNSIEKDLGIKQTESHKDEVVGFTIVDQKVYDARQAIIEGRYDEALVKCQEVLNLEPDNITSLEIMGSAFFMMDQPEKAKQVWMKVLEIDPSNKVVPEFLNQLK